MKLQVKYQTQILLLLILFFALFLRVYHLNIDLPALYSDEVDLHYKIYGWLTNLSSGVGTNIYNIIVYTPFSFTWFLGLTPLAVRLPAAVFSSLSVICIYFLAKNIASRLGYQGTTVGIITALLTALLPWSILIGRIGFTHIPISLVAALIHMNLWLTAKRGRDFLISLLVLLVGIFYHQTLFILAPIVLFATYFELTGKNWRSLENYKYLLFGFVFLLIIGMIFLFRPNYSNVSVGARGLDLAIWRDANVTSDTNLYRGLARSSAASLWSFNQSPESIASKLIYNFPAAVTDKLMRNYLSMFSPEFLFLRGDVVLRHSTGQSGPFLAIFLPFMLVGIYQIFRTRDLKLIRLFIIWVLITPLAAALTKDGYAGQNRITVMMPLLTIAICIGMFQTSRYIGRKFSLVYWSAIGALVVYSAYGFLFGLYNVYPSLAAKDYEYGFKQLSFYQESTHNESLLVIWDGYYPQYHFRFWQQTPFTQFQNFKLSSKVIGSSTFWQAFPNLYFSLPQSSSDLGLYAKSMKIDYVAVQPKYLNLIDSIAWLKVKEIDYPSGDPDFYIYRRTKLPVSER